MYAFIFGVIGGFLILAGWFFEAEESVRKHKRMIDLKHAIIYVIGVGSLSVYSYSLGDPIFFWLNIGVVLVVLFEVIYGFHFLKEKKKRTL